LVSRTTQTTATHETASITILSTLRHIPVGTPKLSGELFSFFNMLAAYSLSEELAYRTCHGKEYAEYVKPPSLALVMGKPLHRLAFPAN
jgi:hypothetical protein